jgi:hypothetical protein
MPGIVDVIWICKEWPGDAVEGLSATSRAFALEFDNRIFSSPPDAEQLGRNLFLLPVEFEAAVSDNIHATVMNRFKRFKKAYRRWQYRQQVKAQRTQS